MANDVTNILPKILARGLMSLRQKVLMPRLVNSDYMMEAAQKGSVINIPLPVPQVASDVTPSNTPPAPASHTPDLVQITMDNWKKTDFFLTDKEQVQIDRDAHFVPMQTEEALKALARGINQDIFAQASGVFGYTGTAGTTPFGGATPSTTTSPTDATQSRKILNQQLCPAEDRRFVLDFSAEANALTIPAFRSNLESSKNTVIIEGEMGRFYGFDWYSDDDVPTHTAGTAAGSTTNAAGYAIGIKTITLASAGTGTIVVGDIITFAGQTQTYVVTAGDTDVSNGGTVSFYPGLVVAIPASATAITLKGVGASFVMNLGFHRNAFAYASRPLMQSTTGLPSGSAQMTLQDPKSGVILRLELSRQYKQEAWEFDVLWGSKLVRPELAVILAG